MKPVLSTSHVPVTGSAVSPLLGCIADDYTGATDLSSMLVRAGLRVIQCFGVPEQDPDELQDADAVVIALKSRSIPASEAVTLSLDALRFLQRWGAERFFFKYCSTFDSTSRGNIGPVAVALADALRTSQVLFCPAFPENGRVVREGQLFVDGVPLHDSSLRNHPLNPMTDSNLVNVLQTQSDRRVSWMSADGQSADPTASFQIMDAQDEADLKSIAEFAASHVLLTGGSAIAQYWAESAGMRKSGVWQSPAETSSHTKDTVGRSVILAGSCSDATRQQISQFAKNYQVLRLNVVARHDAEGLATEAVAWCQEQWAATSQPLLICSGSSKEAVAAAQRAWGQQCAAEQIERVFGKIAFALHRNGIRRLIVAGGETSGAVLNALQVRAVRIGDEIAPGVPWIQTLDEARLMLVLKSGNFGGRNFFAEALEAAS